jgi:hypothetical protein
MAGGDMPMPIGDMGEGLDDIPPPGEEEGAGGKGLTPEDADTVQSVVEQTMDIVRQTLEMVGKAKPKEEQVADKAEEASEAPPAPEASAATEETPPEAQPGPVTGQPGLAPDAIGGPLKLSSVLDRSMRKSARGDCKDKGTKDKKKRKKVADIINSAFAKRVREPIAGK